MGFSPRACRVAPFTGAWIETIKGEEIMAVNAKSHPSRVRGLKPFAQIEFDTTDGSHPSRVRGLKLRFAEPSMTSLPVAPFTGAWIETRRYPLHRRQDQSRTLHGCVD